MSFWKKPDPKEQLKATERENKKVQRDLTRDKNHLEAEEKKLEAEIKKMAKQGNKEGATILAKQLIQLRQQRNRNMEMNYKVGSITNQAKVMNSNMKLADAMKTTGKTMANMNKVMKPEEMARMMQQFERENMKMGMTEEIMNETLDGIFNEEGNEEDEAMVLNQVLDEIGIEINSKVAQAPAPHAGRIGAAKPVSEDDDLEKQLARLKAL